MGDIVSTRGDIVQENCYLQSCISTTYKKKTKSKNYDIIRDECERDSSSDSESDSDNEAINVNIAELIKHQNENGSFNVNNRIINLLANDKFKKANITSFFNMKLLINVMALIYLEKNKSKFANNIKNIKKWLINNYPNYDEQMSNIKQYVK
jgi:Mg2+/citrate symporter